jgi:hypothetical protein
MAKINKPLINRKGAPPPEMVASKNLTRMQDHDLRPMNFKVKAEFKREFKSYATQLDKSMVELLQDCFDFYRQNH